MKFSLLIVILALNISSCYKPVDDDITNYFNDPEVMNVTPSATAISADGVSTVDIVVELPTKSANDKRAVTFNATAGKFVGSNTTTIIKTAELQFDGTIEKITTKATLRATLAPQTVTIRVSV